MSLRTPALGRFRSAGCALSVMAATTQTQPRPRPRPGPGAAGRLALRQSEIMRTHAGRPAAWVVSGPPGAGKSSLVEVLLSRLLPTPARLDKDTLFAGLVAELLSAYGRPHGEREGQWYDDHVKCHEYAGMAAASRQIRGGGCPVLLEGPFTSQIREVAAWRAWVNELGGEPVRLIWVHADSATLRARLVTRGEARDAGKLANFDAFLTRMRLTEPPVIPHLAVDNSMGSPPMYQQLAALLGEYPTRS